MQTYFYFLHHYEIYLVVLRAVINYLTSKWQMRACEVGHANSWANKLRRWWMVRSGVRSSCGCLSQLQTRPKLTSIILTVVQQYRGCSHPDGIDIQRIKQCILYMVIYSDGLVQDCSALAMELLQSYTKPLQESIPRLFNGGGRTTMTTRCAPACIRALPVKPQGAWARGIEVSEVTSVTWPDRRNLQGPPA